MQTGCVVCILEGVAWCSPASCSLRELKASVHTAAARRRMCRGQDIENTIYVICEGWAAHVIPLADGKRQIVSFLLPGDIVAAPLSNASPHGFLEALTEVQYRAFRRAELNKLLHQRPGLLERFTNFVLDEKARADKLIVDLGLRNAEERIARLILRLAQRLAERGMAEAEPIEIVFPLRQHHIADATGLTPVHTNKVLSKFRRDGLIEVSNQSLRILDPPGFRGIADMR
jgi:CRP/FNR family transcriptional regulator, anaerobic regulatory protein